MTGRLKPKFKVINVFNKQTPISPHPDLSQDIIKASQIELIAKDLTLESFNLVHMPTIIPDKYEEFVQRNFPAGVPADFTPAFFAANFDSNVLISGQWALSYLLEKGQKKILFKVVSEESVKELINHDILMSNIILSAARAIKQQRPPSKNKQNKENKIPKGIICPLCGKYHLVYCRDSQDPNADGLYQVACFNRGNKRCLFVGYLTMFEYRLFRAGELVTAAWLTPLQESCPVCKTDNAIFLRTLRESETTVTQYRVCINKFKEHATCDYNVRIVGHQ